MHKTKKQSQQIYKQELSKQISLQFLLSGFLVFFLPYTSAQQIPKGIKGYKSHVEPFFKKNCISCHGPEKSKGKLTIHSLDADLSAGQELERWEDILEAISSHDMPPEEEENQPTEKERKLIIDWIDSGLKDYVSKAMNQKTVSTARRLTNFEYHNTMKDLFGFELLLTKDFPKDPEKPYHFNNTAPMMLMGAEQMDHYEKAARKILNSAIVDPIKNEPIKVRSQWKSNSPNLIGFEPNELAISRNSNKSVSSGMRIKKWPKTGEFRIRFKAAAVLPEGYTHVPLRMVMGYRIFGVGSGSSADQFEVVDTVKISNNADNPQIYEMRGRIENFPIVPETKYRAGGKINGNLRTTPAHIVITPQNIFDDGRMHDRPDPYSKPRATFDWIEFEGHLADEWPPKHHTKILFTSPLRNKDTHAYVNEVIKRFMTRAFRRPVKPDEVARYTKVYQLFSKKLPNAPLEELIRKTLTFVLISPDFLYHLNSKEEADKQYNLASRLSYFLWGSMPDQELITLAEQKKLTQPDVIDKQVRRMLADSKSQSFIRNFTTQWLSLEKAKLIPINLDLYPRFLFTYDKGEKVNSEVANRPKIRDYMVEESVRFIEELIKSNESLLKIVDSDFAMLNQPLARHYKIKGVEGLDFRRVQIQAKDNLGGLLTQASILIGNGTGTAPHPIYRAVWLREAILGDKVKDPPADVPALSDSVGKSAENATRIKDLLKLHRTKESCADCHNRLDPWGIPFENYNAIGQFETFSIKENVKVPRFDKRHFKNIKDYLDITNKLKTEKIDATTKVPHGPQVDGLKGLKKFILRERSEDVAKNVTKRLLGYALGRDITFKDRYVISSLVKESKKNKYQLQDLIIAICKTEHFIYNN